MIEKVISSSDNQIGPRRVQQFRTWLAWQRYNDTHFINGSGHIFAISVSNDPREIFRFPSVVVTNTKGELRNVRPHSSHACFCLQYKLKKEVITGLYVILSMCILLCFPLAFCCYRTLNRARNQLGNE